MPERENAAEPVDAHTATRRLLVAELDGPRFSHPGYLAWFYDQNPRGAALQEHDDDPESGRRVGHYAVLPTRFRNPSGPTSFIFSSNVATDSTIRRSGSFRRMAERMYARAATTGAPAMVGVGNDASTVVVVDRFGWHRLGPMRARVLALHPRSPAARAPRGVWRLAPLARRRVAPPSLPGRCPEDVQTRPVDAALLASEWFAEVTNDLDCTPVSGWAQCWDTEFLRWRLSRPDGGYTLHVSDDAIAVSHRELVGRVVPVAVLLKVLPRRGATLPLSARPLVRAAAHAARTPFVVYVGWNAHVHVGGVLIPRRLQPSPLNVVLKVLDPARIDPARIDAAHIDVGAFRLDTWELLDMDAY